MGPLPGLPRGSGAAPSSLPHGRQPPRLRDQPEGPASNCWATCRWVTGQTRDLRLGLETPKSLQRRLCSQKTGQTHAEPIRSPPRTLLGSSKKHAQGGTGLGSPGAACTLGFHGRFGGINPSFFFFFKMGLVFFEIKT